MPPKRKATAAGGAGKKAKTEPAAAQPSAARQMAEALKKAGNDRKKTAKVDSYCCQFANNGRVVDDYDCMLNQTNIGFNNNKYYVIQVIESGGRFYSWNRWGRVGEPGATALKGPVTLEIAVADFKKKFQDKTKNKWDERDNFKAHPGKYTLLEMGEDDEDEDEVDSSPKQQTQTANAVVQNHLPCKLDKSTQDLIKLIFDNDMFNDALKDLEIDVKKMPLGKISKMQIAKGFEALEQIEDAIKNNKTSKLAELSSLFYTLIPHNFGRQRPPTISDNDTLRRKMDMLIVLADIEIAQSMQKEKAAESKPKKVEKEPHPLDVKYELLQCNLSLVDKKSQESKILENYLRATEGSSRKLEIQDIWKVDRSQEGDRFSVNKNIGHRKLLWHGTNVAVVAAILKGGLRIMPHSGGRVGKGIYFASENGKSACYVGPTRCKNESRPIGIMFLGEVALGKEYNIKVGNCSLTSAPKGYDSIVARGHYEPDAKCDTTMTIDGHKVIIPQGKPVEQPSYKDSHFSQSEYLIYREDQCRIRYLLQLKF